MSATVEQWIPGIKTIRNYRREWLSSDLVAGVSVAAVAVPIGIAYAQLAGFPAVVGIYSCNLPLIAYALFGSSRQLIVNPDAAACAMLASTVVPLAAGNPERYMDLTIVLTLMTGVLCIAGGFAGFGIIANFLSRPILTGYLNGIALSIIVGQLGKLLGYSVPSAGFFRTLYAVISRLGETHIVTMLIGVSLFALLRLLKYVAPRVPAPLIAVVLAISAVYFFGLNNQGVTIVGSVPAGFPVPRIPSVAEHEIIPLLLGAAGIVLVSFCSMMTTARGFAAKNGYTINANQDMIALGASDIASAVTRGFIVSGADSRTAVADSSGGKTQVTGIIASIAIALVLLFFTAPLAYLPTTALAAILISSAIGLFDVASLRRFYYLNRPEFRHALIAMIGVMTVGVLPGVLIAVGLALLKLLRDATHPHEAVYRLIDDAGEIRAADDTEKEKSIPRLMVYRFESSLLFFNADHFTDRVRSIVASADPKPAWFVFNAESVPLIDITGADALETLQGELKAQGIVLAISRPKELFQRILDRSGVAEKIGKDHIFSTLHGSANAYLAECKSLSDN